MLVPLCEPNRSGGTIPAAPGPHGSGVATAVASGSSPVVPSSDKTPVRSRSSIIFSTLCRSAKSCSHAWSRKAARSPGPVLSNAWARIVSILGSGRSPNNATSPCPAVSGRTVARQFPQWVKRYIKNCARNAKNNLDSYVVSVELANAQRHERHGQKNCLPHRAIHLEPSSFSSRDGRMLPG